MKRFLILLFCIIILKTTAFAGGGDHYPNGAEDFLVGAVPPPGFYAIDYNYFYFADEYKDNSGNTINSGPLDDFSLRVYGNILRLIYVSKIKILGASYATHLFIPWVEVNANSKAFHVHKRGLADIIVDPFILAWHSKYLHAALGIDIYVPTGEYDKHRPVNIGKNFWTFEPVFALTFLHPSGFSASLKLMYDINTTNNDYIDPRTGKETSLKPGQEFHFDCAIGYSPVKWMRVGLSGYAYFQTTDDEIDGKDVENQRGRAYALGPTVMLNYKRLSLIAKSQFEFGVKNRPQGNNVWIKLIYAF